MAAIFPFRGLLYNPAVDPQEVVAPPYDVISSEQQRKLYETHPHNVVRLILNRETDPYGSSAHHLRSWVEESILVQDSEPSVYALRQQFSGSEGIEMTRVGVICLCRLEDYSEKIVLPHEKTLPKPRADRLNLFIATSSNFCQVFGLYDDASRTVEACVQTATRSMADRTVQFEGIRNSLWRISDPKVIGELQAALMTKEILIADGHHRYETALAYRDLMRERNPRHTGEEPYNFVMMFLTNMDSECLVVCPTHRVIHALPAVEIDTFLARVGEYFSTTEFTDLDPLLRAMKDAESMSIGMVLKHDRQYLLLQPQSEMSIESLLPGTFSRELSSLDVFILHEIIIGQFLGISQEVQAEKTNIDFVRDAKEAAGRIERGEAQIAFILNPPQIENVQRIARSGNTMPQKSTYFYPKLLSGLVMYRMTETNSRETR